MTTEETKTDPFTRLILTVCAGLLATGVTALWQMSSNVARLEERMAGWTRSITEQVTVLVARDADLQRQIFDALKRIERLEYNNRIQPPP